MAKAKRQQQDLPPQSPDPNDDFEDVEEQPSPPQTIEEIMRRMMQTIETSKKEEAVLSQKEAQIIPDNRPYYQPIVSEIPCQTENTAPTETETEIEASKFDIRQAVIASEILNRKY